MATTMDSMLKNAPLRTAALMVCIYFLLLGCQTTTVVEEPETADLALSEPEVPASRLAQETRFYSRDTLIPLVEEVRQELSPEAKFSLGLDRYVRDGYLDVHHKNLIVITNRLAVDSDGAHILETLLLERKPRVRTVVLFNDELPEPGRSAPIDRIIAAFPEVRVYERSPANITLSDAMFQGVDTMLIDLPLRGGLYRPEVGFLAQSILEASLRDLPVTLLDRPTALFSTINDGPTGDPAWAGGANHYFPYRSVMTLTPGEAATLFNTTFGIGARLSVVELVNWRRFDGWSRQKENYREAGIDPSLILQEWNHYYPTNGREAEIRTIQGMLPAQLPSSVEAGSGTARLILTPAQPAAEQFGQELSRLLPDTVSATVLEGSVILEASQAIEQPAFIAVCIWSIAAKADRSLLPPEGEPNIFGDARTMNLLWENRSPLEIQRLWELDPGVEKLAEELQRVRLY